MLLQQFLADELYRQRLAEAERNRMGIKARRQMSPAQPGQARAIERDREIPRQTEAQHYRALPN